jgi:hypothetical protein
MVKPEDKECLATYVKVGNCEAWTLWDSGSTMTFITPSFAQVADVRVFPLEDPHCQGNSYSHKVALTHTYYN